MKAMIKKFILLSFLSFFLFSCDYLDKEPDDMKTDDMVWSSRKEVEGYLANVYAGLPRKNLHQDDPWVGCSDECDLSWNVYNTYPINLGNWSPNSWFYYKWGTYYKAIRASFVFEKNVGRCDELSEELKNQYRAEVKFLRGYYYWLLLRQYGPFVLLKELPADNTDWNSLARAPFDVCVDYICQMMDEAENGLPLHWQGNMTWIGKPNKIVCKAVKSIVLTTAASPQWNGNKEYESFRNPDGTPLVNTTFDINKWHRAAAASKAVIEISENNPEAKLRLYRNDENGDNVFNPYKSVQDAIIKLWNCEWIWGRTTEGGCFNQAWMIHAAPSPNNLGGVGPTQRLVDAFLMKNGKPIEDPQSGYVETGFTTEGGEFYNPNNYDLKRDRISMIKDIRESKAWGHWPGEWNMYANREPRFYANILYNKRVIPYLPDDKDKRDFYSQASQKDGYGRVELYYGGTSRGSGATTFYSKTGYLAMKYCDPQANMKDREFGQTYGEIYIRYATILLNYIEALNEIDPTHPDIRKYWDQIRFRAGVPSAFDATPYIAGDQQQQLDFILRERQIELCFEEDRYFTTRRRWVAHQLGDTSKDQKFGDGGPQWGMSVNTGDAKTNNFTYTGFYTRTIFETRVFNKSYYLFPIPQSEVDKNRSLVQNPWW